MNDILTFDLIGDDRVKKVSEKVGAKVITDPPMRVRCVICRNGIANIDSRISVSGNYERSFTNPYGFRFRIAFFQKAFGCMLTGKPTDKNSWFLGFDWRVALCNLCRAHLGWAFRSSEGSQFFGLIIKRLSNV